MPAKPDQTVSFVMRFTQKIYKEENGESNMQWRGKISHVQGDETKNFLEFEDAIAFIQERLSELTKESVSGKTKKERDSILSKSKDILTKMSKAYPKMVLEAIKDPKGQINMMQEQMAQIGGELNTKLELDSWRMSTKSDHNKLSDTVEKLAEEVGKLSIKIDALSKKSKK